MLCSSETVWTRVFFVVASTSSPLVSEGEEEEEESEAMVEASEGMTIVSRGPERSAGWVLVVVVLVVKVEEVVVVVAVVVVVNWEYSICTTSCRITEPLMSGESTMMDFWDDVSSM